MNTKTQAVLERVQAKEAQGLARPQAIDEVLREGTGLTHDEVDALLEALETKRIELTVQW